MVNKAAFAVGLLIWCVLLWGAYHPHPSPASGPLDAEAAATGSGGMWLVLGMLVLSVTAVMVVLSEPVSGKTGRLWAIGALVLNIAFIALLVIGTVVL